MSKEIIKHVIFIGDSLCDNAQFVNRSKILGKFAGINSQSKENRFTDKYTWVDIFKKSIISRYGLQNTSEDLYDVSYDGVSIIRTYTEGGMYDSPAHSNKSLGLNFSSFLKAIGSVLKLPLILRPLVSRKVLSTLENTVETILFHDELANRSLVEKNNTLVILWTGVNDLITVNAEITEDAIEKSLSAKFNQIERLINQGYRNFNLFNLPNISETPEFQLKEKNDRDIISKFIARYNNGLLCKIDELRRINPDLNLKLFDVRKKLSKMIKEKIHYGFSEDDFKVTIKNCPSKSNHHENRDCGYNHMFWDGVHPSTKTHHFLYKKYISSFENRYDLRITNKPQF